MTGEGGIFPLQSSPLKDMAKSGSSYTSLLSVSMKISWKLLLDSNCSVQHSRYSFWSSRMYEVLTSSSSMFPALYIGKLVLPLGLQGEKMNCDCLVVLMVVGGGSDCDGGKDFTRDMH